MPSGTFLHTQQSETSPDDDASKNIMTYCVCSLQFATLISKTKSQLRKQLDVFFLELLFPKNECNLQKNRGQCIKWVHKPLL